MKMCIAFCATLVLVFIGVAPVGNAEPADDPWTGFRFLLGDWKGAGSGAPGQSEGEFSFRLDLDGKILVRKNVTKFPVVADQPAVVHEDLMIVYPGKKGTPAHAIYFDSEGHVIEYTVSSVSADQLVFMSEPSPASPRFRLAYKQSDKAELTIKFEIATPAKPETFRVYLEGSARRIPSPKLVP